MSHLILVRHGQSQWNLENRFTGWVDVDLSDQGREEARRAGGLIRSEGLAPVVAYTSRLKRAIRTLWLVLEELDRMWLDYTCSWRLNERHYGALQGLNKAETAAKHGDEQVHIWRRSYDVPPPPLDRDDPMHPRLDPRYASVPPELLPAGESLKDTLARLMPFWHEVLGPRLAQGGDVLVAAHGNSLRAVVKHLEGVSDQEIPLVEIPTGNPLVYELGPAGEVLGRRYLDPGRAAPLPGDPA